MDRRFCVPAGVRAVNLDALVTAPEIALMMPDVSRHLVGMWARQQPDRLPVRGYRGRSPLYRLGDVLDVERRMRQSGRGRPRALAAAA